MSNSLVFEGLPLPPSSNQQYVSFLRHGRIIHAKSKGLVAWKSLVDAWTLQNQPAIEFGKTYCKDQKLSVHVDVYWPYEKLYTKSGSIRKMDVSNRLKALHDALATMLLVDDSRFWHISACKKEGPESVSVYISQIMDGVD